MSEDEIKQLLIDMACFLDDKRFSRSSDDREADALMARYSSLGLPLPSDDATAEQMMTAPQKAEAEAPQEAAAPSDEAASAYRDRLITGFCSRWSAASMVNAGEIIDWLMALPVRPAPHGKHRHEDFTPHAADAPPERHHDEHVFNAAINYAIEQGVEASTFLEAWREGDTSEWPEFKEHP